MSPNLIFLIPEGVSIGQKTISISISYLFTQCRTQASKFLILCHEIRKTLIRFQGRKLGDWVGKERGCWVSRLTDGRMCWRRPRLSREQEAPEPRWPGYLVFLRRSSAWVAVCTAERGTAAIRHAVLSSTLAAGYLPPTARPQTSLRHAQGALKGSPLSVRSAHRQGKQDPRGGRGLRPGRGGRGLPWCTSRPADPGFVGPRPSAGPGARGSGGAGLA